MAASFAPSLLSSAAVASSPHPERKTVLVDAGSLLLNDMLAIGAALQRAYRQGYSLEGRNTQFTQVRGKPDQVVFNIDAHFATANLAVPQPGTPPGVPQPTVPRTLPDARSMLLGLHIAIGKLPETPMAAARGRCAHRPLQHHGAGLRRRPGALAAPALREPLAPGEEGSGRGGVRAGQADHLLARPHDSR